MTTTTTRRFGAHGVPATSALNDTDAHVPSVYDAETAAELARDAAARKAVRR